MAGAVVTGELTRSAAHAVEFSVATHADDTEIRALLRNNPMAGDITISLEREPDYFIDANLPGEQKQTIIARERGKIVCAGACTVRQRFVNGRAQSVGYLGGLRLDGSCAGRFDVLRRGYELFRELQSDGPADFYFTSIASDNHRARAFLEGGIRGMPTYEFVGEFVTLVIASRGRTDGNVGEKVSTPEMVAWLNKQGQSRQFAPCWTERELSALQSLGLKRSDFMTVREGADISASVALWDQRAFKQTVVRGYSPALRRGRRVLNLARRVTGLPALPRIGEALSIGLAAFIHFSIDSPNVVRLIRDALARAHSRGINYAAIGLAANDPCFETIKRSFKAREYRSRIYVVRWPGLGAAAAELDARPLGPELAFL